METAHSFGSWLTLRRKQLRISRVALAERIGCATVSLQKIEIDERRPSEQLAARLADQLQIASAERRRFIQVARGELPFEQLDAAPPEPDARVPALIGQLFGRAGDLQALHRILGAGARLLTLSGPGGVGKTRLAIQLAQELRPRYADGIQVVDLAPLSQANQVLPTIAQTLGVIELPGAPLANRVGAALRDRQLLLLLDNFEHVIEAAPVLSSLMQDAPRLTILVTSRVVLRLADEYEYTVVPLSVPPHAALHTPISASTPTTAGQDIGSFAAIQLFIARTRAVQPHFGLSSANAGIIVAICQRLDGLPLAIELAAARLKIFTPVDLLRRLDQSLDILTGGARDRPTRQQTLRATLDWSYQLLAPAEQRLLQRLAVFVGGWTLAAAEAVCADADAPKRSIIDTMQALLDQSLVQRRDDQKGAARFGMLETIREYVIERLEESGERATLRGRHAAWALQMAETMDRVFSTEWHEDYISPLTREHANLLAALDWYRADVADPEPGLRLVGALYWFWAWRGYRGEARFWLSHFLERPTPITIGRAKALLCAGDIIGSHGEGLAGMTATELLDASLICFRALDDERGIAVTLPIRGRAAWFEGDHNAAERYLLEGLELSRRHTNRWGICWSLICLSNPLLDSGDYARTESYLSEALAQLQAWKFPEMRSWAIHNLGRLAHVRGDQRQAAEHFQLALAEARAREGTHGISEALIDHGRILHMQGDDPQALANYQESYHYIDRMASPRSIALWLEAVGGVGATQREPLAAARLFGAAAAIRGMIRIVHSVYEKSDFERDCAIARSQLPQESFDAAWAAGQALTIPQAVAEALSLIAQLIARLLAGTSVATSAAHPTHATQ